MSNYPLWDINISNMEIIPACINCKHIKRQYGEKVVVRNAYYKSDEPWVTFRDIRDLFPKDSNDFREVAGTTSYGITHWKHI